MVLPKSKNAVGLGNSLMVRPAIITLSQLEDTLTLHQNDRFGKGKTSNMHRGNQPPPGQIRRTDQAGNDYITPAKKEAEWVKMRSVTEQGALDEFLSTAELAGTDFTAERMNNVKIIHRDQKNPYLLSKEEERGVVRKQDSKRARLTVPRRPAWDENTSRAELDSRERESLLDWRRGLAELQEQDDLLMTPFERNLEVWRQLWRVLERSDLVVQIVDARNPLLFRCDDLERYVKEVDPRKRNLLLVNKADMMSAEQRRVWAEWFGERGVNFRFFSAELARAVNEAREGDEEEEGGSGDEEDRVGDEDEDELDGVMLEDDVEQEIDTHDDVVATEAGKIDLHDQHEEDEQWEDEGTVDDEAQPDDVPLTIEEQTRILTTDDLEALFLQHSPSIPADSSSNPPVRKTQIGLVGYPNVGKSSTINALLGSKRVSVSATPGKTKHFQTIHLSPQVILCDCPGLVFPNFATTKAELVCNGILPIDQLREYTGPATLVAERIPQHYLEVVYGIRIATRPLEEGGTGSPTGEEVLRAYARARGFSTQGLGQPDESRAARTVLKDYVKGKLLFVHPPPGEPGIDAREFNREVYVGEGLDGKGRAPRISLQGSGDDAALVHGTADVRSLPAAATGRKGQRLDKQFFAPRGSASGVVQPFHYKYSEQGQEMIGGGGKQLSGRKLKIVKALERDVDPAEMKVGSKKHFKGGGRAVKGRGKVRQGGWSGTVGGGVGGGDGGVGDYD